uniref:Putative secreted protein n=1 Tax=Ixodes ricinus TaxID=34613 RepID=A0A6B0UYH9_IXORI
MRSHCCGVSCFFIISGLSSSAAAALPPSLGVVCSTVQARKASRWAISRTPRFLRPRTPSVSKPSMPPLWWEPLSVRKPGVAICPTSGTTMRVPVKSQRSPAWATSTASALTTTSTLRGMFPRGSSACVSWMRTFWKSTKVDRLVSRRNRVRLLHTGFLQMVGWVYLNCCSMPPTTV